MSHLSILPTVLSDLDRLETALRGEGYALTRQTEVHTLGSGVISVDLLASRSGGDSLAWRWSANRDHLELVTDLQRQAISSASNHRLHLIIRRYALLQALESVREINDSNPIGGCKAVADLIND